MELNSSQIQEILPHRYPFLLVDRISECEPGSYAKGIKCVSANEMHFLGHFPGHPVMPGVLIIEALAQVGAVALLTEEENKGKLAFFGGIIFGVLGYFLAPQMLKLMDTPDSIITKATTYLRIYFLGCPVMVTFNFGSQMLRALGDSKRPLYFLIISGLVNVLFDLFFVIKLHMDVAGVAIATIISQIVSAVLVIWWFHYNKRGFVNFRFKKLKFHKQEFFDILKIGLPAGLQGLAFSFPNVLIQSSLYTIDSEVMNGIIVSQDELISGSSAAGQIEGYIFAMIDSFAVGCVSVTGQNYGAKNTANMRKGFLYSLSWMSIFWAFCALIATLFGRELLQIFITDSQEIELENAILAGEKRLLLLAYTYLFNGAMDLCGCYLRGMKKATLPAILTVIGCTGTRILFLFTLFRLDYFHNITWLYAAYPISWILVDIVYVFLIPYEERKIFKSLQSNILNEKGTL